MANNGKQRRRPGSVAPATARMLAEGLAPILASNPSFSARKPANYGRRGMVQLANWEHEMFGEIRFDVSGVKIGNVYCRDSLSFAPLFPRQGEPTEIVVDFDYDLLENIFLFRVQGDKVVEVVGTSEVDPLKVSITWEDVDDDKAIPHTRQKDKDNIDLVLLRKDGGQFVHIQVAVASRNGRFYLTIQDLWGAQAVWDDESGLMKAVPIFSQNAYASADYLKTMGNVGVWLLDFAAENCELFEAKDVQPAVWQPSQTRLPENMKEKGWSRATVLFFNLIWNGGSGFAICDDGKPVFIHFNDIVDGNGRKIADYAFPFLLAEQVVAVRFNESNRGRKATAVKVIEC